MADLLRNPHLLSIFKNPDIGLIREIELGVPVSVLHQSEGKPFFEGFSHMAFSTYDFFLEPDKDARYEITYYHDKGFISGIALTFEFDRHLSNNISFQEFESVLQEINQLLQIRYGLPVSQRTQNIPHHGTEKIRVWTDQIKRLQVTQVVWFNPEQAQEKMLQLKFSHLPEEAQGEL